MRRIAFHGMSPSSFDLMLLKIAKYDDSMTSAMNPIDLQAYQKNTANYGEVFYKPKKNPMSSWAVPFVTGHKYRMYWDIGQLNWSTMKIEVAMPWLPTDKNVFFNLPYTENYEAIDFFGKYNANFAADGTGSLYFDNQSLANTPTANLVAGMNTLDVVNKELTFVINAKTTSSRTLEADSVKCRVNEASWCVTAPTAVECTGNPMPWSDISSWVTAENPYPSLPKDGDDVEIPPGRIILFDLAESPKLKMLKIVGCLEFLKTNTKD